MFLKEERFKYLSERIKKVIFPTSSEIESVILAVTYLCDNKCLVCNIWKRYRINPFLIRNELTLQEIKNVFSSSQYLRNIRDINLTGGEPFLCKHIVELCLYFMSQYSQLKISISSNGTKSKLITEKLREIIEKYELKKLENSFNLIISLDGIGVTHDRMRGISGVYNKVMQTIEYIKKLPAKFNVGLSFTITLENYRDLLKTYELSKKLNLGFSFRFAHISRNFYGNEEKKFLWSKEMLDEIEESINAILSESDVLNNYFYKNMIGYQRNPRSTYKCYSGTNSTFLDPHGNVYPCVLLNRKLGNVRDNSFDELWVSNEAKKVRKLISQGVCSCWSQCEADISFQRNLKVALWSARNKYAALFSKSVK